MDFEDIEEFNLSEETKDKLKNPEFLKEELAEGKSIQEIFSYSEGAMKSFYKAASSLFERQQYEEAADAFFFLANVNPHVYAHWLGLGMSEQLNEQYSAALIAYNMASATNPQAPLPHYHSASCYFALKEPHNALASLELAIKSASDTEEFAVIRQQALAFKDRLLNP